jgi:signal transduction histidine kinase
VAAHRAASRSILCIPIQVRGEPHACLYLSHADVTGLFGEDERRIGDFLATLAGAALENADGFNRLQRFSGELERQVHARTRELEESLREVKRTQDQLLQASKLASLGTLIAGLSHELNNPLGVVIGNVQVLLQRTPEGDPSRGPLLAIERQALRSNRLIRALLDFSRARERERIRTSPTEICDTVLEFIEAEAKTQGARVRRQLADEPLPELEVSIQEIESALLNLLSNAIDVTPAGGEVSLEVSVETRDGRRGVAFRVSDEGPGIPSEIRSRIFDPFFTTKPVGRGTGLGLSIAHQIVHSHDGAIEVDGAAGGGTTMTVWLPAEGLPDGESARPHLDG